MKKSFIILFLLLLTISGCSFVGKEKEIRILSKSTGINLEESFYLIYPKNGVQETFFIKKLEENKSSAKEVTSVFKKRYGKKFGKLTISQNNINLEEGFKLAKNNNDKYLINIEIQEWKDAMALMCKPNNSPIDNMKVMTKDSSDVIVSIYDVSSKSLVNKQRLLGKGCPVIFLNFIPIGANSPESYLKKSLKEWEKTLK